MSSKRHIKEYLTQKMKHIKLFESASGSHSFVKVDFTGGGDGVYALYIDGKLHKYGDYYHDKISEWIEAFTEGAKWAGLDIKFESVRCIDEDIIREVSDNADIPPKMLSEIPTEVIK